MKGALENDVEESVATYIFDLMEKFAGYGFNKSHSAAYALVSYQTAWLKAHYPAEFMAAVLSADMDNTEKVVMLIDDCRQLGLTIVPPDINQSEYRFTVNEDGHIVYGMGAIKGAGEAILNLFTEERVANGNYKSLANLCERISAQKINKRIMETLIKAGAFDNTGFNRHSLMEFLPEALRMSSQFHRDQGFGQSDLFGGAMAIEDDSHVCPHLEEWPERERLQLEKVSLGLYLTGHPINEYKAELKQFVSHRLIDLVEDDSQKKHNKTPIIIAGLVSDIRFQTTDRGKRAFIQLDDQSAYYETMIFNDVLEQYEDLIVKDEVLIIEGKLNTDWSGNTRLRVEVLHDINSARNTFARRLRVTVNQAKHSNTFNENAQEQLEHLFTTQEPTSCPIVIEYKTNSVTANIQLGPTYQAPLYEDSIKQMIKYFGENTVHVEY